MNVKAFAVWFEDLRKWNPASFRSAGWQWPAEVIKPLSSAIERHNVPVDKKIEHLSPELFISIRFGGKIEPRELDGEPDYKGSLFWAEAGNLIYSKIDCRNGAIGIVPREFPRVVVTSEFPVYKILTDKVVPEYIYLVFQSRHFLNLINGMVSGASGRKRVQPQELEEVDLPLPAKPVQQAIVTHWRSAQAPLAASYKQVDVATTELDEWLFSRTKADIFDHAALALDWDDLLRWDVKSAKASSFRIAHPSFVPFGTYAEEATELVNPRQEPEHDWPVYGVNNKEGVFFSSSQPGSEFNASYKRIRRDWFFHNPTRSSVGSLGHVPDVPEDAITSPEYQVWRLRDLGSESLLPGFVSVLIRTSWFVRVIQFHRVGAVKQRLYVENLLEMPVPRFPRDLQEEIAIKHDAALIRVEQARLHAETVKKEVEEMILGIRPAPMNPE